MGPPWGYLGSLSRVQIVEFFSKLIGPGPLGSGGHSHTSFSNGRFRDTYTSFHIDVLTYVAADVVTVSSLSALPATAVGQLVFTLTKIC